MVESMTQFFENIRRSLMNTGYMELIHINFHVINPDTKEMEKVISSYDSKHGYHFVVTKDNRQFIGTELEDLEKGPEFSELKQRYDLLVKLNGDITKKFNEDFKKDFKELPIWEEHPDITHFVVVDLEA